MDITEPRVRSKVKKSMLAKEYSLKTYVTMKAIVLEIAKKFNHLDIILQ